MQRAKHINSLSPYTFIIISEGDDIPKIQHVQTVLLEDTLNELKRKSNKVYSKDALTVAVDHYLDCKEPILRAALQAARNNLQKGCSQEIIKQIDTALGK